MMRARQAQKPWSTWKTLMMKLMFSILGKVFLIRFFFTSTSFYRFLRINDPELAEDYTLPRIPCLVFFRREIPIVYPGDVNDENEMLEWLIKNQSSADDEDVIEHVDEEKLEIMVDNVDNLMIYFYDNTRMSTK